MIWLVGENNDRSCPRCADLDPGRDCYHCGASPLYPLPPNCSGHRLCVKVLETDPRSYLRDYCRTNLVRGPWRAAAARATAKRLLDTGDPLVLLGSKVCAAFGVAFTPFKVSRYLHETGASWVAVLPHPSGLSRLWNEPHAYPKARRAVAELWEVSSCR